MAKILEESISFPLSAARRTPTRVAQITGVPAPEAGRVLSPLNVWIAAGLTLLPIVIGIFSVLGGLGIGISVCNKVPVTAAVLIGMGLVGGVLSVVTLVAYQQFLAGRYLQWVARRAFARRTDSVVHPNDPEAVFVDVIPRSHWGEVMLEPATDIGFFAIDHGRHELLFEGDLKRYRIPFESIESCQIEEYSLGYEQWKADVHFITVLTVETDNGPREIPLAGRHLEFCSRRATERRVQANTFCSRILVALNA
jgi:hypothetical protein